MPITPTGRGSRLAAFFFMHFGTLVAVVVYFHLCGESQFSASGVRSALLTALLVKTGYMAVASWYGERKHFDVGVWLLFAIGLIAAYGGIEPVFRLYREYSPALLFLTFALVAAAPLVSGIEPFTNYYARRQLPRWQLETPEFASLSRVMSLFWALVFLAAAALCAWSPRDPMFTFVYPNLLVFLVGMPSQAWLPPLYFKLFPPAFPRSIEPLLLGMPLAFDRKAAGAARARIQFCVTGETTGDYWLRIANGKCESFEGLAEAPDVVIRTPERVWMGIARGEIDGGEALMNGLYTVEGDYTLFARLSEWFVSARR